MGRFSYREQDYAFGQMMLTLRTDIGLTQGSLAEFLGVSRRAVGAWEAGNKYPNPHHLKQLIALAIQQHAFPAGEEADAVRTLWRAAHQKVLLDERWLASLLTFSSEADDAPPAVTQQPHGQRIDWGGALAVHNFYGREWELAQLSEWILQERCRVVGVLGLGGIGKSSLSVSLMHQIADQFEVVIWRSLRDTPTCEALLADCLRVLVPQSPELPSADFEQCLNLVLQFLREHRALIVLDNLETLLEEGDAAGRMRAGYEDYGTLLRRLSETEHRSSLLFTSRENPISLVALESSPSLIRLLRLNRLESKPCEQLLAEKGVIGSDSERAKLIDLYAGNPLALKIVAQTIVDLFDGGIAPFLDQGEVIFGGIRNLLAGQFARLSPLEQSLLLWLAILREPATLNELSAALVTPVSRGRVLEALQALYRRSLIERGQTPGSFTLQSVVLEYLTARLVEEASAELQRGEFSRLIEYGFELAYASAYVRETQERLLLRPLLDDMQSIYLDSARVESVLVAYLDQMRGLADAAQGYAPATLLALLKLLRGHLRSLDLSGLALRSIYLQGVEMQDTRLINAALQDSRFTEMFDPMTAVAVSRNGEYWAASSRRGEIRLWEAEGYVLRHAWRAHTDMSWTLAFSPNGQILASGSYDGMIKLWDVASGSLLWANRHATHMHAVAFSPDGQMIASSGPDGTVQLWDVEEGRQLEVLYHPRPLIALAWSPDGRLIASGDQEGGIHLWEIVEPPHAISLRIIDAHQSMVDGLSFSPDNRVLASAGWDNAVKLWDVPSGRLKQTLTGHTNRVRRVVWSPDGRLLASCSFDKVIALWDVEQISYCGMLKGHSAELTGVAFTPDSQFLLSGSEDGTLRLWDISREQSVRVIQGYSTSLYDVAWSPDGNQVVSGGTDRQITIYSVNGDKLPRVLEGDYQVVFSIDWSSDGRWIASSEWDNVIRLWDAASGDFVRVLHHHEDPGNYFYGLGWNPSELRLASGTYRRGIQVFDLSGQNQSWVGCPFPSWIRPVSWSPDGKQIAGGSDDGNIYICDTRDGSYLQQFSAHQNLIRCVAWSPDGKLIASSSSGENGELFVWDTSRAELFASFDGDHGMINTVAWSPDGQCLISGGSDGFLRWWDVHSGSSVRAWSAHQGAIHALKRSPDGKMLASCGDDGAIKLWDLGSGAYLRTLRRDRPYERMDIRGIRGLNEAQKATLLALGAVADDERQQ